MPNAMNLPSSAPLPAARAALIAGLAVLLGLLFDLLFWDHLPGLNVPLYVLFILGGLFTLSRAFGRPLSAGLLWLCVPLVFFAAMIFVRASEFLILLNIAACLLLLLMVAETAFAGPLRRFALIDYLRLPVLPLRFLLPLYRVLLALVALPEGSRDRSLRTQVLKGLVLALPVLLLFLVLFASADLVFRDLLSHLVDVQLTPATVARIILVLLTTLVLIGASGYALLRPQSPAPEGRGGAFRIGPVESSVVLGSVGALFLVFIVIQFAYLFGGERAIALPGMTYAEYARRGFLELTAVAVISWLLLLLLDHLAERPRPAQAARFKGMSLLLIAQVALIMVSAHYRLTLYEDAYGFTLLRFFSHALIALLAVVFALLVAKILRSQADAPFAFRVFLTLLLFLATLNLLNPEAFVARRNIARFAATGKLDVQYLGQLSEDAIPQTMQVLDRIDDESRQSLSHQLYNRTQHLLHETEWQSLNLSRLRAQRLLAPRIGELTPEAAPGDRP